MNWNFSPEPAAVSSPRNSLDTGVVGAVEIEPYCRAILQQRQKDRCLPSFPVWNDVTTFRPDNPGCAGFFARMRAIRDDLIVAGGFPCQNISSYGRGEGIAESKSGLWHEMARIVAEIRPRFVFTENSPLLATRGLEVVLSSLASMGYDARWCVLGAGDLGYPIKRDRLWILGFRDVHHGVRHGAGMQQNSDPCEPLWGAPQLGRLQDADRDRLLADGLLVRKPDGLAHRVDRIRALGNGQVPAVAALAWRILTGGLIPDESAATAADSCMEMPRAT